MRVWVKLKKPNLAVWEPFVHLLADGVAFFGGIGAWVMPNSEYPQ